MNRVQKESPNVFYQKGKSPLTLVRGGKEGGRPPLSQCSWRPCTQTLPILANSYALVSGIFAACLWAPLLNLQSALDRDEN